MTFRMNYVQIDLKAFRFNIRQMARKLKPHVGMMLVIKADAYGHGMIPVAKAGDKLKAVSSYGVFNAKEALLLKKARVRKPILILGGVHPGEASEVIRGGFSIGVSSSKEVRSINAKAARMHRKAKIHLELDTGMGRSGALLPEVRAVLTAIKEMKYVELEGIYTHFSSADEPSSKFTYTQLSGFESTLAVIRRFFANRLPFLHMANSSGLTRYKESHYNVVRPGIMAFGINPLKRRLNLPLKRVLSLKSHVALLKTVGKGFPVSYGRTYHTRQATRLAVIPIGYSSGYPFQLSNCADVLIRGKRYPVAGRVTMNQIVVDIGGDSRIRLWDEVVLIGQSGGECITAEELAEKAKTIPYQIVTSIHPGIERVYLQ